jgi:hypothetical protein
MYTGTNLQKILRNVLPPSSGCAFCPEDECSVFLRKVDKFLPDYILHNLTVVNSVVAGVLFCHVVGLCCSLFDKLVLTRYFA